MNQETPRSVFTEVFYEVLTYIIYVGGIALLEYLRKKFEMPTIGNLTLLALELALLLGLIKRVVVNADTLIKTVAKSWTVRTIARKMNSPVLKAPPTPNPLPRNNVGQGLEVNLPPHEDSPPGSADDESEEGSG